jgi:hypothetical protein
MGRTRSEAKRSLHEQQTQSIQQTRHVPEIKHLNIKHAAQHPDELSRRFDSRTDDGELAHSCQALERPDILEEVVVQVERAQVRHEPRKVGRKRREPAGGELEIDKVIARLRDEASFEWVPCRGTSECSAYFVEPRFLREACRCRTRQGKGRRKMPGGIRREVLTREIEALYVAHVAQR